MDIQVAKAAGDKWKFLTNGAENHKFDYEKNIETVQQEIGKRSVNQVSKKYPKEDEGSEKSVPEVRMKEKVQGTNSIAGTVEGAVGYAGHKVAIRMWS
ncbi:hypothetical protein YC2023_038159 [Brassica napus]